MTPLKPYLPSLAPLWTRIAPAISPHLSCLNPGLKIYYGLTTILLVFGQQVEVSVVFFKLEHWAEQKGKTSFLK